MNDRTKKLFNNTAIFGIVNFGTKFLSFIMVIFYTYIFTTEEYGIVDLIVTSLTLIVPLISLYLHESVMRFVMDKDYDNKVVFSTAINETNIIFFPILILAIIIINVLKLQTWYYIFILVVFFQCYYNIIGQFVRGSNKIKEFAIGGIINAIILLISNVLFLFVFHWSIAGYLLSMLLSYIIACLYYIKVINIKNNYSIKIINKDYLKDMMKYCIPLIPNGIMWWVVNMSDRYMLLWLIGKAANGLYATANKIPSIISLITNIFFQAWQLTVIEENKSDDNESYFSKVFNYFFIISFLINSLVLIVSKPIVFIFLSKEFVDTWKYVPFLLISVIFSGFSGFLGTYYAMVKKTKGAMISTIIAGISNIIINLLLIPRIGINGAAISTMISMLILWIVRVIDTRKFVKMKYDVKKIIITLIISTLQIALYYFNIKYAYIGQVICIILIILIYWKEIKDILNFMKKKIGEKRKNEKQPKKI